MAKRLPGEFDGYGAVYTEKGELKIDYSATTDKATVVN